MMSIQMFTGYGAAEKSFPLPLLRKLAAKVAHWACLIGISFVALVGSVQAQDSFKPFKLKTLDGAEKTLADFGGKATLVSFFFPSCPYCNASFPEVEKLQAKYADQGLSTVWINVVPGEQKKIPGWMQEHGFTIPVLVGASQASLMRDYKLKVTPTHYLLDAQGKVLFHHAGYAKGDEKKLEEAVQKALNVTP